MTDFDASAQLITTLALMFGGALVCGALPFFLKVKETHIQTLSALGAGLLVGSALAVIIPEGFHAFAQAGAHSHSHDHDHEGHGHGDGHGHGEEGVPEGVAGLVLVLGFLAMLLLDRLQHAAGGSCGAPGHTHTHGHSHTHGHGCGGGSERGRDASPTAKRGKKGAAGDGGAAAEAEPAVGAAGEPTGKAKKGSASAAPASAADPSSAVAGLLIHCAADGLAMGAAFLSGDARLSMLVAAAMVLHKAPMAFGLGAYLLSCGWGLGRARPTLLAFAAAAPLATLATYSLLGSLTVLSSPAAVALCVIFSGGTFLHAATMHILPEALRGGGGGGHAGAAQLAAVVAGSLLPVALSWGHEH